MSIIACAWIRERQRSGQPSSLRRDSIETFPHAASVDLSPTETADFAALESTLDRVPIASCWLSNDGRIVGYNQHFATVCEIEDTGSVVGTEIEQISLPTEITSAVAKAWMQICRKGHTETDQLAYGVDRNGIRQCLRISGQQLLDKSGRVYGTLLCFKTSPSADCSKSYAESISKVIMQSPGEVYFIDAESLKIVEANQGACENLGFSYGELTSMSLLEIQEFDDRATFEHQIAPLSSGQVQELMYEIQQRRQDTTDYTTIVHLHRSAVDERPVYVAFATDLTQWLRLQAQVHLSHQIRSITQFAGGVSHEINSPLQCLLGNLEFITPGLSDLASVKDLANMTDLVNSTPTENQPDDLNFLVDQLPSVLDEMQSALSQITDVIRAMHPAPHVVGQQKHEIDINKLIEKSAANLIADVDSNTELQLQLCNSELLTKANPAELTQVLRNLVTNGAEAIQRRRVDTPSLSGKVVIRTQSHRGSIRIEIEDNGIGMTESVRRHAFDPLFTTKEVGEGLGQGLGTCFNVIVNELAGIISLRTDVGKGTCIAIELPTLNGIATSGLDHSGTVNLRCSESIASDYREQDKPIDIGELRDRSSDARFISFHSNEKTDFDDLQGFASQVLMEAEGADNN